MNMQTLDMGIFLQSLTPDQIDVCENDQKRLAEIFEAGWSEETAVLFHRAMLFRRIDPKVTVEGLFESALRVGLSSLVDERKQKRVGVRRYRTAFATVKDSQ